MNKYRRLELEANAGRQKKDYKYFVGSTQKDALSFTAGEKMVFKIRVRHGDDYLDIPFIRYTLETEDGRREAGHIEKAADGWFYIEGSISRSGFVYVKAWACDESKQDIEGIEPFNGSAGADVAEILCSSEEPEDYLAFWQRLKAEVAALKPELLFTERLDNSENPDFEMYNMRLTAPRSEYASVAVAYPAKAEKGSLKLAMYFQGYSVLPTAPLPRDGYLTVHVTAHCMPNGESPEFYTALRDGALKGYGFHEEENKSAETTYWTKMLLRDLSALHYFKDHELLNQRDYAFIGSSQGGMQACLMAAHFERTTEAVLNVPWLSDIYGDVRAGRHKNSMPKGAAMPYFDIALAARHLKCPTYVISGLGDLVCNPSTQMALYNAIPTQKFIDFYQNKTHSCSIPWDNCAYTLGDISLVERFAHLTQMYYGWN